MLADASSNARSVPSELDAVVIGAGPNGLAAAICLARAGRSVVVYEAGPTAGGGCRSAELIEPGTVHDVCAAVHAFGLASPFLRSLDLARRGVEWCHAPVALAHPLDHGRAAIADLGIASTTSTIDRLHARRYRHIVGPLAQHFDDLASDALGPLLRLPRHPGTLARFGAAGVLPATTLGHLLGDEAGALAAGCAAHSFLELTHPLTAGFALLLLGAAHAHGWPMVKGGSQVLTNALVAELESLGGTVMVNHPIRSWAQLPKAKMVLADLVPASLAAIAPDQLPAKFVRRATKFKHGPGVFKVDYTLSEPVPWINASVRGAGTVHVGGSVTEIAASEHAMAQGRHHEAPFVLVAQSTVADPSRAPHGHHTLWTYCHVPSGSTEDRTSAIESQIERFAPGFRDVIVGRHTMNSADFERYNANNRGGDIAGGWSGGRQLIARGPLWRSYRTGNDAILLCGASTPPGGGVHGMCGANAAQVALRTLLR